MSNLDVTKEQRARWQVPNFETDSFRERRHPWCVVIPVINEGARIQNLLAGMYKLGVHEQADIIIIDGGSTDDSLGHVFLESKSVTALLIKKDKGRLSAQLRCAYAYALDQGYQGIVTIDGNDKDDPEAINKFITALENGVDFAQASRFIPGGVAENTPPMRNFAIKCIHAPMLSLCSGFRWTDTTQGFRAYSRKMLVDPQISPFRDIFSGYELLAYLSYRAPKLGYRCIEIPTLRRYPKGEVPTKISAIRGNLSVLAVLFKACSGGYNP